MINSNNVYIFLQQINDDFRPSLSTKVDLVEYVNKIASKAELIIESSGDGLVKGLVVLYCNNKCDNVAYISLVGVLRMYRGEGIAKKLVLQAILKAKQSGMKCIQVHSNNPVAIRMYQGLGFQIVSGDDRKLLEYYI